MDLDRLRYFCTVAQVGSLQQASEVLRISPAAISKALKVLESEVGIPLLIPDGRGIRVSDYGKTLAKRGKDILDQVENLKGDLRNDAETKRVRIGSFEVFTTYLWGHFHKKYLDSAPFTLHEFIPGQLETAILDGHIDYGITYIPIPTAGIDHMKVTTIQMGVFATKGTFSKVPFAEIPFAVPVEPIHGSPTKVQGLDGWPDDRIPRYTPFKVTLMETAMELARQGQAAAYLATFIARLHNERVKEEYRLFPVNHPHTVNSQQPVYLIKRKSDTENETVKKLAAGLRVLCGPNS